jgi:type I restriction enzyme S subunit
MKNWEVKKLGDVCSFFNGQAHEKCIDENGKYKLINSKFVSSEGENFKRTNNALSPLFVNDIVMVMSDVPNGKTLAKCFVVDKVDTYTLNQRICVIRSKNFDTRFLYYQLNRNKYLLSFDNGENQSNLRKDDILNCELFVPPLPEQQRIVAILDEAFAAIAKAKANAEQNLKNAKELFESYLQGVFENGNWKTKKLNEITEVKDGTHDSPKYIPEGIPFVTQKNIRQDGLSFADTKFITDTDHEKFYKRSNVTYGDILISMIGANRGMAAIVDDKRIFSIKNVGLIKESENINKQFLLYFLKSSLAMKYILYMSNGGAQEFIGLTALRSFPIPYPPLKEQQSIVQKLDALLTETKKLEAIYQQKINDLEELKKSVLQKAFSGELKTDKLCV